jgi:hypothetical protein
MFAGHDAPEPNRSVANAGVDATIANASAIDATFAIREILMYFPS